ncbi:GNAT family acetyltransferase [Pelagicoccus sp. SDUM812002]|uniref:GNAT family acetyltransferase n=1 Tax=Pelagicoccus sp. SDUM812002 TaxID=3041266 RepID=UPI00280E6091|nr:GNAT family acetyltransferase [Pelagicoccus sp. SDUM812002]MDQ8184859.1 GNAT family acetyltransferase [Pelagicoccus sp. SDUM812002]
MKIRPYHIDDRDSLVRLWNDCGLTVPRNHPDRDIERKLRVNPEWLVVGIEGGTLVASVVIGYEGHRGWINYLAVDPTQRGKGFAEQLMSFAEESLSEAGCPKINLQIRSSNKGVRLFYEKLGYAIDPVISMGKRLVPDSSL